PQREQPQRRPRTHRGVHPDPPIVASRARNLADRRAIRTSACNRRAPAGESLSPVIPLVPPRPPPWEGKSVHHGTCGARGKGTANEPAARHAVDGTPPLDDIENQFHSCDRCGMAYVWRLVPLAGVLVFFGLGIGLRAWLHARRHGSSGIVLFRGNAPSERLLGAVGVVVPAALLAQATVAAIAPDLARGALPASCAPVLRPLGAALLFGGSLLMFTAQLHLGASWRVGLEHERPGELVTSGPLLPRHRAGRPLPPRASGRRADPRMPAHGGLRAVR